MINFIRLKVKLVYDYLPIPRKDSKTGRIIGQIYYPVIPIKLCYKHHIFKYLIHSLVDSGSDRSLFPAEIGENIGIKIRNDLSQEIIGIGGIKIIAFTHEVKIYLKNLKINTFVDFSYEQKVPLLGRDGFFSYFKTVNFREKDKVIELER